MKQILGAFRRTSFGTVAALFLLTVVGVALPERQATAASLIDRSLQVSSTRGGDQATTGAGSFNAAAGTAANGQRVSHTYIFKVQTAGVIKDIQFQYCDSPFGHLSFAPDVTPGSSCGTIAGFTAANALSAKVYTAASRGAVELATTGHPSEKTFDRDNGTSTGTNVLNITSATGLTVGVGDYVKVYFDAAAGNYFKNPNQAWKNPANDSTYFAHIELYADTGDVNKADPGPLDEGTVTTATANTVSISTRVQETLKFSVGGQDGANNSAMAATDPGANCAALGGTSLLTMGDSNLALAAGTASTAKSYARLSTNSSSGAKILYAGETLISTAGDVIPAAGPTAVTNNPSAPQFGLTVKNSDTTGVFEGYSMTRTANYANPAMHAFDTDSKTTPVPIATSDGIVTCDTLPIEYIASISNDTPAGLYSTKVSYIAVPAY